MGRKKKVDTKCPSCKTGNLVEVVQTTLETICDGCGSPRVVVVEHNGILFDVVSGPCKFCGHTIEREDAHDFWNPPERVLEVWCDNCEYSEEKSNV